MGWAKFLKHGPQTPGDLPESIWGQNYFRTYTESFCCTPETNIMLNVSYISQFKKKFIMDFPCAQTVKNLHVIHETQVQSLAQEDPLEKWMATRSSILAWRIPWIEEPGGLQTMGWQRVGHDWATKHTHIFTITLRYNTLVCLFHCIDVCTGGHICEEQKQKWEELSALGHESRQQHRILLAVIFFTAMYSQFKKIK